MKRITLLALLGLICLSFSSSAQILTKKSYQFDSEPVAGLKSNSITDIFIVNDKVIFLGTGKGLARTEDGGQTWVTYTDKHGIGKGGVSAIAVKDSVVWVATAFDSVILEQHEAIGGGVSYSTDLGKTWTHLPQPMPTPNWTIVNNVIYDIAIIDSTVWVAAFGGGLMKSSDMGRTWLVRPPDGYNFNPDEYLSHRVFSLLAIGDTLWVGTAGGINVSYDGGETWPTEMLFNHQHGEAPISGNFVVALDVQKLNGQNIIWAATINAEDPDEFRAVSKTADGGRTWATYLPGKFTYNFAFDGEAVYAATDSGLWKSPDGGQNWDVFPQIEDSDSPEKMYASEFYGVAITPQPNHALWVGSSDGLAVSLDDGLNWNIMRAFVKTGVEGEPRVYAYPNPFTPMRFNQIGNDGFVRFQFNTINATHARIRIFDFAMELITTIDGGSWSANTDASVAWNCRDDDGNLLANGVYFYQLELSGDGKYWGKLIIVD
ncbi:hypothetical protein B6D60_03690 [candidate division KSB1 bacterium 4484_87]|nr:MAG: hypothetical protein B6D60_03690 [candidate division KSB1 bacterium 4484_87]